MSEITIEITETPAGRLRYLAAKLECLDHKPNADDILEIEQSADELERLQALLDQDFKKATELSMNEPLETARNCLREALGALMEVSDAVATWRDASMKLCDALDSILHEDSDKTEQARLTDRVIASELLHIVRSRLLPEQPQFEASDD